jgi:hypothetical protein
MNPLMPNSTPVALSTAGLNQNRRHDSWRNWLGQAHPSDAPMLPLASVKPGTPAR